MEKVSARLSKLAVSATLAMTAKSRELKAQGFDVVNLSIGEPDFNTPDYVKEAAKKAIDDNITHYPPVPGFPELRKAVSEKFKRENNLEFSPDQIVVSAGAKHSIINVFLSVLDPGDEVIVPAPYWVSYVEMIKLGEAETVVVPCSIEQDFKITPQQLEDAITDKTRAMIFSSPSNPTGSLYSKEELAGLVSVLKKYPRIIIISDEIYEHINFVGEHQSIAAFNDIKNQVVVVNGVSKGYAMTGWRIGYIGAPLWIAKACTKLQGQFTSAACSIAQKAAEAAINAGNATCKEMMQVFKKRRDLVLELVSKIPGFRTNTPQGAFYIFPDITGIFGKSYNDYLINNSDDLAMYLLEKAHVATVAGSAFGSPDCLRLSYAASEEELIKAFNRIKEAIELLR
ncbi:MAG: pyridoxal phosphate-dependent aminotransferase, partial [Bacteroidales bacterium]|nr:pyridoxal phosphate-dependent aminotransferase [Bacteroidales bacterium]MDD4236769.1 pyridoxal phosphate-dependent aminotransferase [Bacteroidales bacterium]